MTVEQWMRDKNIANYGPHLEPIIRLAFEAGRASNNEAAEPRDIADTIMRVLGTPVQPGRCDFVDSIFGQCILEPGHQLSHVMSEDQP